MCRNNTISGYVVIRKVRDLRPLNFVLKVSDLLTHLTDLFCTKKGKVASPGRRGPESDGEILVRDGEVRRSVRQKFRVKSLRAKKYTKRRTVTSTKIDIPQEREEINKQQGV